MIQSDWHIHTRYSPCGKPEATLALVVQQAAEAGVKELGITDHLHCRLNLPALRAARREYDALGPVAGLHFGVEVSCLREWDLEQNDAKGADGRIYGVQEGGPEGALTLFLPDNVMRELRFEYVIGGAHWPLGAPLEREAVIRSYHRQNLFLAAHPLVDIVAHPWWFERAWKDEDDKYTTLPWFDDFTVIPRSMHVEFAAAAREHGKAIEINAHAIFLNPGYTAKFHSQYWDYVALLRDEGVTFSIGSDSHAPGYDGGLNELAANLEALQLREEDFWRPSAARDRL